MQTARRTLLALAGAVLFGCGRPTVPDPQVAARQFAEAARRGDADAIHRLLSREGRVAHGRAGVRRLVQESRVELARAGAALARPQVVVDTAARVRFIDGETAELKVEHGRFVVTAAAGLPSAARTPAEALAELRQALARRSYSAFVRVLSRETQVAIERDLRSLVTGLERAESLDVKLVGDRAEVAVPGGHIVRLKKEAGFWKVDDFD
jgi:hypothetical protein